MRVAFYAGYGGTKKRARKRKTARKGRRRSIGAASRHCAGLGKRKRKACMRSYMSGRTKARRGKKRRSRR